MIGPKKGKGGSAFARALVREQSRCSARFKTGEAVGDVRCKRTQEHRGSHRADAPWGEVHWAEKKPDKLTPAQERELRLMVTIGGQATYGAGRARAQNGLVEKKLARLVEIGGLDYCVATEAGRAALLPSHGQVTK